MFTSKLLYILPLLWASVSLKAQDGNYSVGTPQGSLSVSEMGAAVYNLDIEVPNGGPLTPHIGLQYNSQMNGYGLAGYGVNITGISCITRGGKDLFHDRELKGVTYTADDNYYLDGKRLILKSGTQGKNNSVYTLEGNPYTIIYLHSKEEEVTVYEYVAPSGDGGKLYAPAVRNAMRPNPSPDEDGGYRPVTKKVSVMWFEVSTPDGNNYQYGNTHDSRFVLRDRSGLPNKTIAWYINQAEDKYSNRIEYSYQERWSGQEPLRRGMDYIYNDDLVVRPQKILYGLNTNSNNDFANIIEFSYNSLGKNARSIVIAGRTGKMDVCLASITAKTNNDVYRKYSFTYDNTSDATPSKWSRLVSVTESNGNGESYKPIALNWEKIPSSSIQMSSLNIETNDSEMNNSFKAFSSADVNGDGISDIVQISVSKNSGKTKVFVNVSNKNPTNGTILYERLIYDLGSCGSVMCMQSQLSGLENVDYDGDGLSDIIIPVHNFVENDYGRVIFYVIYGKDILAGRQGNY